MKRSLSTWSLISGLSTAFPRNWTEVFKNSSCLPLLVGLWLFIPVPVKAQNEVVIDRLALPVWYVVLDGNVSNAKPSSGQPIDSVGTVAGNMLADLQKDGYYFARLDSIQIDSSHFPTSITIHSTRGPRILVGSISIGGNELIDDEELFESMNTRSGQPIVATMLEKDLDTIISRYEERGYPLAEVSLEQFQIRSNEETVNLQIHVEEGPNPILSRIELVGAKRTRPWFATRLLESKPGEHVTRFDPEEIQRKLLESGLFSFVGNAELVVDFDTMAVIRIPVEEAAPGNFDLVLGYQPATLGGSGGLIGNGHLLMRNLFGGGRVVALRLNRLPGQISHLDIRVADPYVVGLPVGIEGRFEGLQQDSTYGKQRYTGEVFYRFQGGLEVRGSLAREFTRPGHAGLTLNAGKQNIARSSSILAGLGLRLSRVDHNINPRKGIFSELRFEEGRKEQFIKTVQAGVDTLTQQVTLRQSRFRFTSRAFIPTFRRQVFVLGVESALLVSREYDRSDLFRFGGASTLRGYDEDRFRGRFVGRSLVEYRYLVDQTSYGYLFFDLGYINRPILPDAEAEQGFYPGYGFGIQFRTQLGIVNATYAMSPEDGPINGRVHVGLSFGL